MKTLGKIAGGVGTLFLLTSLVTLFVTTGSVLAFAVKLGLGVALVALWALTNGDRLATLARALFFYSSSALMAVVLVTLLAAANFIVAKRGKTWDLTSKRVYSLSPQTEATLESLRDPVKVIAFTEQTAPDQVEQLFRRYQQRSDRFTYEFKDPRRHPDLAARYQIHQGQPVAVLVREATPPRHQLLNLTRLGNPQLAEQELTQGLIKLDSVGSQKLYFVVGHGEAPLEAPSDADELELANTLRVKRALEEEGYAPASLNLVERGDIPLDASAVVLAGPRTRLAEPEVTLLTHYLETGGRMLLFAEPGTGDTGLEPLCAQYGLKLEAGLVADTRVSPEQPYYVLSPFFGEHEITRPLDRAKVSVLFPVTRAVTVLREGLLAGVVPMPLVLTTPSAWLESTPTQDPEPDSGERQGQLTLAALATRGTSSVEKKRTDEARLVVFGDADVLSSAFGHDPNRNLVLNALAWATQQGQKVTIRPPDRDLSTIDLAPETISTIRLLSMDIFPTLLIGVGLAIWLTRRSR